jgi:Flp pilus assembly protein TadD
MFLVAVAIGVSCAEHCLAVTNLKRGAEAPAIALKDQNGAEVTTATLKGHVAVLIFGELYHDKTREAWLAIDSAVRDVRLVGQPVMPVLIMAQDAGALDVRAWTEGRPPGTFARDPERRAFGAFQVAVMPSVVVIGTDGKVVYAVAGLVPRFADVVTDALLYACGKLSAESFDRSLNPVPATQPTEAAVKAERVAQLARQLARRGLPDMAADKYREAIELNPRQMAARLGFGTLLLNRRRLAEAEVQFRAVLAEQPDSKQASIGLAFVQAQRGGSELEAAEKTVRGVLVQNPFDPRAHYLLGLIYQQRNKPEDAAASFKKSSELLLERAEQE